MVLWRPCGPLPWPIRAGGLVMTYRGFTARVDIDERDGLLVGRVLGLPARVPINFHGDTVVVLSRDFPLVRGSNP